MLVGQPTTDTSELPVTGGGTEGNGELVADEVVGLSVACKTVEPAARRFERAV
jgi:hypothetical protein